jgi:2'-5' RNA ligase
VKQKTHTTAVVLIPPREIWEPIQAIRREHDRQVRRWMPHVTLVYPFRPRALFDSVAPALGGACARVEPFSLRLARFGHFCHRRGCYTLWLAPEPETAVVELQEAIWRIVPDCDEVRRFTVGFTPHLSVGQVEGPERLDKLKQQLQASWREVTFVVREVSLIWRGRPPDDAFRVDRPVRLGRCPADVGG